MVEIESDEQDNSKESIKVYKNTKGNNFDTKVLKEKTETEEQFRKRLKDRYDYLLETYGNMI
jgi:uncharacterized protein (UPF0335 family)